jgi:N-acylneuraminate cytidylyltransferase
MYSGKKILGLIPARGGSKGIPMKNIKLLNDKPLIFYTYDSVKESKLLTRTIVSTDNKIIKKICENLGMDVPFLRPSYLAKDDTPTYPVVFHALEMLEKMDEYYDIVCLLQPTVPFRNNNLIDSAIKLFIKRGTDSLFSVRTVPHYYNPHWVYKEDKNNLLTISTGEKIIISRRQDLPKAFIRDGAIYLIKTSIIKNQNSLYGNSISYIEHTPEKYINLDILSDWKDAEMIMRTG